MNVTFPGESPEYRAARERLLEQEIELRRATEAVAAARRALPAGGVVPEDYVFAGADGPVRLSELFAPAPTRSASTTSCSRAIPRTTGRASRRARARRAWRSSTSSTARSTRLAER